MGIQRFILIMLAIALLVPMVFGGITEQPESYQGTPDFEYNPDLPSYKIIGAVTVVLGDTLTCNINYFDADTDKIRVSLLGSPGGMTIVAVGETEYISWMDDNVGFDWQIQWTPDPEHKGVNYVDVQIEDAPWGRDPLIDRGTLLVNVVGGNIPPTIGGCTYVPVP